MSVRPVCFQFSVLLVSLLSPVRTGAQPVPDPSEALEAVAEEIGHHACCDPQTVALWKQYLGAPQPDTDSLRGTFASAATEFGVPARLLEAIAQVETNWTHIGPSIDRGWGILHLVENPYSDTLGEAAKLLGVDRQTLKDDVAANIRGAAALLAEYAGKERSSFACIEDWLGPAARFSGLATEDLRNLQAETYFRVLREGVETKRLFGDSVRIEPDPSVKIASPSGVQANEKSTDYPPALTSLAPSCNFTSGRNHSIDTFVNHWIGTGTYAGAISWFLTCESSVSAHFVIRASDGQVTQCVRVADTAYHAGAVSAPYNNSRSIGVEHEVTLANPAQWNSPALLNSSTTLARYFCDLYGIPKTRALPGVRGHMEMPGTGTACPGPLPWDTWMSLLTGSSSSPPTVVTDTAINITAASGLVFGRIASDGGSAIVDRRFDWGTNPAGLDRATNVDGTPINVAGSYFSANLTGLNPATTYYYRAWAQNAIGWAHGDIQSFETSGGSATPAIEITGGGNTIPPGSTSYSIDNNTEFGYFYVGEPGQALFSYRIYNRGTETLVLTGDPLAHIAGSPDFSIDTQPASSVGVGAYTIFKILFDPTVAGSHQATVTVESNDPALPSYTFGVHGEGRVRPTVTPTYTLTDTPFPTATVTPTATSTPSPTATASNSATLTPTFSQTFTQTGTPSATATPSPTDTLTPSETATGTWTPTQTETPPSTPTSTASGSPSSTPTLIATPSSTGTSTPTVTVTETHSPSPTARPSATGTLSEDGPHPADTNGDFRIGIGEAASHLQCWRNGDEDCPIGLTAEALFLWRNGECYEHTGAGYHSVPCPQAKGTGRATLFSPSSAKVDAPSAVRVLPDCYAVGTPLNVTITLSFPGEPPSVVLLEDEVPAGWIVEAGAATNGGVFSGGKVRWSFVEGLGNHPPPPSVTYVVVPPAEATGTVTFTGTLATPEETAVGGESSLGEVCPLDVAAIRHLPDCYAPGGSASISIDLILPEPPPQVVLLEDRVPEGWDPSFISDQGNFSGGKVRWSFIEGLGVYPPPQAVTYSLTIPVDATGEVTFMGTLAVPEDVSVTGETVISGPCEGGPTPTPSLSPTGTFTATATGTEEPVTPTATTSPTLTPDPDLNHDGLVDARDLLLLMERWHRATPTPTVLR
ncbi:MAG: hypothetical protein GHCLOJNM_03305 [bacterium]|nr:hypothetical protein [bacterium]